ncbi:LytR/AlgR family response regulator transcription factor [Hymenobacter weizhouensis]|uniref:LytR/AlgR family response regulator transcription factor n=1 Tax=Hymenobacter sp. YIM 151500-1 TaxID=2987689 RepID=UPI0022268DF8|nr:LytTR family DNA-binding domain-containing protein [Hymenobacter sp. YIM 151500-1]UYZ61517.1 LytTR family DNA-binding domain-containing protein [Hymenobacter sp. YIM 151500-1]
MSTPIKCLVIDDEDLAVRLLEDFVRKTPGCEVVAQADNGLEAYELLQRQEIDLVLLDIQMPHLTGLELLEKLEKRPAVIVVSAYAEYAIEGYRFDVVDYLLKPFSFERFTEAMQRAKEHISNKKQTLLCTAGTEAPPAPSHLYIKADYKMVRLNFDDILYIEGLKQYVKIVTLEKTLITLESMKYFEQALPAASFIRVHKSFIVAINKIETLTRQAVLIKRKSIPVGKTYKGILDTVLPAAPPSA